jgi:hypothetical protein
LCRLRFPWRCPSLGVIRLRRVEKIRLWLRVMPHNQQTPFGQYLKGSDIQPIQEIRSLFSEVEPQTTLKLLLAQTLVSASARKAKYAKASPNMKLCAGVAGDEVDDNGAGWNQFSAGQGVSFF